MEAVIVGEVGAAGVTVDCLLATLVVTVAGHFVDGRPSSSPTASTASCSTIATPSSTVATSSAAGFPLVWSSLAVTALLLFDIPRTFVSVLLQYAWHSLGLRLI